MCFGIFTRQKGSKGGAGNSERWFIVHQRTAVAQHLQLLSPKPSLTSAASGHKG